jgi:sugar/nucleoside kinase (ribokinase family)
MGPQTVIITLGNRGAVVVTGADSFSQAGFRVRTVDSNGAGDAFSAGLLHGLLEGWDVARVARFASAVAALKCTRLGNQGLPRLDEVREFLRTQEYSPA